MDEEAMWYGLNLKKTAKHILFQVFVK